MGYFVISENVPNCEESMWLIDVELHVGDVIELKDDSDNDINLKIVERRYYPWAREWNYIAELLVQPQQI